MALKERFDEDFDSGKIKGPGGAGGGAGASDKVRVACVLVWCCGFGGLGSWACGCVVWRLRQSDACVSYYHTTTHAPTTDDPPTPQKKKRAGGEEDEEALDEEEAAALALAQKLREDQKARNKAEFAGEGEGGRLRYEGFRQGLYVRVAIKGVSAEFSRNFRPSLPVVVGGLLPHEMSMGLLRCRVKRHRWHRKVLKASDPLIFSIGWRRFQSMYVHSLACTPTRMHVINHYARPDSSHILNDHPTHGL